MGDDDKKPEITDEDAERSMRWMLRMSVKREVTEELRKEFELIYARKAGRVGVPKLKTTNVDKYIAAVSLALLRRDIEPATATAMMYAGQLMLAASKVMPPKRERKKRLEKQNIIDGGSLG